MKTRLALFLVLLSGGVALQAQIPKPAAPARNDAAKTDAKKAEPKIEGISIARGNGRFLGLKLEGGTFKLSFYDEKKQPVTADVTRAAARWNPNYKQGSERIILNLAADGKSLLGGKPVRPPYVFKLYLTLLKGEGAEGEQAVESYTVDFRN